MSSEFTRCNDEVTELAWENGELALHGLQTKHQAWSEPLPDIFDSIFQHQEFQNIFDLQSSAAAGKWSENSFSAHVIETSRSMGDEKRDGRQKEKVNLIPPDEEFESMEREKKRARSELEKRVVKEYESTENHDDMSKGESVRSQSSTRRHSRSSDTHNQSERRRRERINQKMRALQKLVPNASKTDKVSMLDEVIQYLKNLQAQVQIMTNARRMHHMAIPLTIQQQQQQLQMLLLARMSAGMLDFNSLVQNMPPSLPPLFQPLGSASTSFIAPPFVGMPPVTPPPTSASSNINISSMHSSKPDFSNVYNTLLAQQSMNMDLLSKMAGIYQQQEANQTSTKTVSNNNNTAFRK